MSALEISLAWRRCGAALRAVEGLADRRPLQFSLLAVLVLLAVAFLALRPSYDTNDDVFMTMIASGQGFCPAPDEHLVFTNVIVGQALKRLYTAWPLFPWYGCYLLAIHYAAQVALLYCTLTIPLEAAVSAHRSAQASRRQAWPRLAVYLIYFALVELLFFNSLQFTTTAFLAAQAGIFLLLLVAARGARHDDSSGVLPMTTAVLLLVVAALVRFESLTMALLVAAPLGWVVLRHVPRRALISGALAAGVAALLIVAAAAYNRAAYDQDPRWSHFFSYNQLRVKFNDYGWTSYTPQTAPLFSAVGWSENDHAMIAHWFFDDPQLYSEANLHYILDAYPWKTQRLTKGYLWQICRGMLRDRSVWAVMLVLPFFFGRFDRLSRARWATIGSALAAVASLVAFLTYNNKLLPARVYFPLLSFPLAALLLFPANWDQVDSLNVFRWRSPTPVWGRAVAVLLVVGIVMGLHHQGRRSLLVRRDRRAFDSFFAELRPTGREVYVCWEAAMPFELISPLDNLQSWSRVPLVNLVWTQRTPWQEEIKRRFGIANLAAALCERDDLVLIATPVHRSLFAKFASEHFRSDVEFVTSAIACDKLVAGRFQRRTPPGETVGQQTEAVQR